MTLQLDWLPSPNKVEARTRLLCFINRPIHNSLYTTNSADTVGTFKHSLRNFCFGRGSYVYFVADLVIAARLGSSSPYATQYLAPNGTRDAKILTTVECQPLQI